MIKFLEDCRDIYLKHKLAISLFISTFFFAISAIWYPFTAIAAIFLTVVFMYSSFQEILCYLIYFMMFSRNTIFYVMIAIAAFVCIIFKFINDVIHKKVKTPLIPFIVTTVICVVFSLIHYSYKFDGVCQGLLIVGLFYLTYILFCYKKELDLNLFFNMLFLGILSSSVVSFILYIIPGTEFLFYNSGKFVLSSIKELLFLRDYKYTRLMLLSYHPNHLNCYCLFIMTYVIHEFINNRIKTKEEAVAYSFEFTVCLFVGFLTKSKAFLIAVSLVILYLVIYLILKYKKKSLRVVLPILGICALLSLCFYKTLWSIFERFFYYSGDTLLSMITSGRSDIWGDYVDYILESPLRILFGSGICASDVVSIGPHNLFIALMFRFGIVGIIAIVGLVGTYCMYCEELNFSWGRFLSMFIFIVYSLQEASIDERFIFLIFSIILLFKEYNDGHVMERTNNQKIPYSDIMKLKVSKQRQKS